LPRNVWLDVVVAGSLCLVLLGGTAAGSRLVAQAHNARDRQRAVAVAEGQMRALQANHGLSAGETCFDTHGNPSSSQDAGAPCSYYVAGYHSGCLASTSPDCLSVRITAPVTTAAADVTSLPVTYLVQVGWQTSASVRGQVTYPYRLVQANTAYNTNQVRVGGTVGPGGNGPLGTADGEIGGVGTTAGGTPIHKLADIPGGPSASVAAASCASAICAAAGYDLTGHFMLTTNVPNKLIASCTWDFGDGSVPRSVAVGKPGCGDGQTVAHSYQATWQMQHLPDYPASCLAPRGSGVDSYVFLVSVTLQATDGTDIVSRSPHRAQLPGCAS